MTQTTMLVCCPDYPMLLTERTRKSIILTPLGHQMESDKPGKDCEFYESVSVRNYLMKVFDKDTYFIE